ncbi:unnamed protein product [Didymodactylos carnosus]|uniref:Uncharacterized protein n=1 Tax=Didymodactylos carnosus TaxID=1234261 RepID=A0A815L9L4_9BILA|nr:unnamed protein product [Didymodactylos carnosus]CAF1406976.1 unnamed protein product [Didymodactylos carnosus]CAF4067330.1 unnamed protein product [Didymodactylos carnosus]CAF4297822.1 unnamed protein product [Didymodactylos carnosus]
MALPLILISMMLATFLSTVTSSSYRIISATAWLTSEDIYPDFSASLNNQQFPTIFQYNYQKYSTLLHCTSSNCSDIEMIQMPGLNKAQLAYGGVLPRRIVQYSPLIEGATLFLSTGYARPNRDTELVVCAPTDRQCSNPTVMNTVNCPGFGQLGLRLTFTQKQSNPIMLIPEARYASVDNRVTGFMIQSCKDPLCTLGFESTNRLPFNLTGQAWCMAASIDTQLNYLGYPSWLTQCCSEMNLINCLTDTCNETTTVQFRINPDLIYFVYMAVDLQSRFFIVTTGNTSQTDITYIRCLDPTCSQSNQNQLVVPQLHSASVINKGKIVGTRVQIVIDPKTGLPILHYTGLLYPANIYTYLFIVCQDVDCDMENAIIIDYGTKMGLQRVAAHDLFIDDQQIVTIAMRVQYQNSTVMAFVRMAKSDQPEIEKLTLVEPKATETSF